MRAETFTVRSDDDRALNGYVWEPDEGLTVRGIVQIVHGMAEHAGRYVDTAKRLTEGGYVVYAYDQRGHGRTAVEPSEHGWFADDQGWQAVLGDLGCVTRTIRRRYADEPLILFGHSMGSFLCRRAAQLYGDRYQGLVLSGTGGDPGIAGQLGLLLARMERRLRGGKARSKMMNRLLFGRFNDAFPTGVGAFDWLSRDEDEVKRYLADPDCGAIFTTSFYCDLLAGVIELHREAEVRKMPQLPVYLFAGDEDPVGDRGQGVQAVDQQLRKLAGLRDVTLRLYPKGRHEMLHEINRQEVVDDLLDWLHTRYG